MIRKIGALVKRNWWVVLLVVIGVFAIYLAANWTQLPYGWTWLEGKTLWDLLELLIIPVTLAVVAAFLDKLERKNDRENVKDNQRETLLQNYIEFMTRLVLDKQLRQSKPGDEVRNIAQTKTQTTYERLDPKRNEALVKFLDPLGLIQAEKETEPILKLKKINLISTNLSVSNLKGAYLSGAHLEGARLRNAHLEGAFLFNAYMKGAILEWADLEGAFLFNAYMKGANLKRAFLEGANLESAHLERVNLEKANLEGAKLEGAHLEGSKLEGAVMPDGKVYDPKIHTIEYLTRKLTDEEREKLDGEDGPTDSEPKEERGENGGPQ